jgi:hypothetical protein
MMQLIRMTNRVLKPIDVAITRASRLSAVYDLFGTVPADGPAPGPLPPEADGALSAANPRLRELQDRYAALGQHPATAHSLWDHRFVQKIDLKSFRFNSSYLSQGAPTLAELAVFLLGAYYVKAVDEIGLFDVLQEDGLFAAFVQQMLGKYTISKDLLDSVNEINFLSRALGAKKLAGLRVLDIGAGYGRLSHRLVTAFPNLRAWCVDAVPLSTFLCEFYLHFRGVGDKAEVVPLDEIDRSLVGQSIDLATNVHSFSECRLETICWWLDLLVRMNVPRLMIVPNAYHNGGTQLLSRETDGSFKDFMPELERRGFRLEQRDAKYLDASLHQFNINTYQYLFRRAT